MFSSQHVFDGMHNILVGFLQSCYDTSDFICRLCVTFDGLDDGLALKDGVLNQLCDLFWVVELL